MQKAERPEENEEDQLEEENQNTPFSAHMAKKLVNKDQV
jgi:hypothetical protein